MYVQTCLGLKEAVLTCADILAVIGLLGSVSAPLVVFIMPCSMALKVGLLILMSSCFLSVSHIARLDLLRTAFHGIVTLLLSSRNEDCFRLFNLETFVNIYTDWSIHTYAGVLVSWASVCTWSFRGWRIAFPVSFNLFYLLSCIAWILILLSD